jgi:hypothetical protein
MRDFTNISLHSPRMMEHHETDPRFERFVKLASSMTAFRVSVHEVSSALRSMGANEGEIFIVIHAVKILES